MTDHIPANAANTGPRTGFGRTIGAGVVAGILLFGALGGWAVQASISGAIIAQGEVKVHGKPQEVQHLDGGLIAGIAVSDGDRVEAGALLLRLDPTTLSLQRDNARARLAATLARAARLRAEETGTPLDFTPADLPFAPLDMAAAQADERRLFEARAANREGRRLQLTETRADLTAQIDGIDRQLAALDETLALMEADLDRIGALAARKLARQAEVSEMQRSRAETVARREALTAERARLGHARDAATTKAAQTERRLHEEIVTERIATMAEVETLTLEIVDIEARLARIEIRAPAAGIVHDMQVATTGGVVAPGDTLLQIVPQDRGVDFETRIDPRQVDQVHPGQAAEVIVAAFDPRSTPRLAGKVAWIAPDTVTDPRTGAPYFRATVRIPAEELARLGDAVLVPGMPIEAYLKTTDRTVASYLLDPVTQTMRQAMRE
ncbi:MAG: secretion protein HlyD [Rhodobacteraceae bacterium]|nr:secretion protein HlyD [Paracoccaceae bacterium]